MIWNAYKKSVMVRTNLITIYKLKFEKEIENNSDVSLIFQAKNSRTRNTNFHRLPHDKRLDTKGF